MKTINDIWDIGHELDGEKFRYEAWLWHEWLNKPDDKELVKKIFGEKEPGTTQLIGAMKILKHIFDFDLMVIEK